MIEENKGATKRVLLSVRLSTDLRDALQRAARQRDMPMSAVVRNALKCWGIKRGVLAGESRASDECDD